MENSGPGPGKYMMNSDFGQVETNYHTKVPENIKVGLNPSYQQPQKENDKTLSVKVKYSVLTLNNLVQ